MIPFSLTYTFGKLVKDKRQGWALFAAMFILWIAAAGIAIALRNGGQPEARTWRHPRRAAGRQLRGQGGPLRLAACGLFAGSTTGTSTGAINLRTTA